MQPQHVIIIAEAGVNHNGSIENAFRLIDAAAEAGVDYIKFQTFKLRILFQSLLKKQIIRYKIQVNQRNHNYRC